MSDSSESGLDVFDDLVRKPKSSAKSSPSADQPAKASSAPSEATTASSEDSAVAPNQSTEKPSAPDQSKPEPGMRAIPPPAVSPSRAPRPPVPSDSGIVPAALLSESRPVRPPALSESRPPTRKAPPPAPPAPKPSRAPLPSSPSAARVPPPASTPGISLAVPAVATASSGKSARWLLAAAGLLTLGVLGTVLMVAMTPKAGTLVVSASGPRGLALPRVATYVDGVKRCDTSPCRVDGLSDGVHIVEARAPGHISIAGKAVKIEAGEEVPFDLELQAHEPAEEKQAAERKVQQQTPAPAEKDRAPTEPLPPTKLAELQPAAPPPSIVTKPAAANPELAQKLAGVSEPAPAAPAATTSQPQATQGTLNINSIPASSVVVDGRPLGRTPRLGVSVTPGAHTVIFIHPEHGRKVSQISVQAGQTATATARFP